MALPSHIQDGEGTKRKAGVTRENALKVSVLELGARDQSQEQLTRKQFFTSYLTTLAGSEDMNVDGSATPVEFVLQAQFGAVFFVDFLRVIFHDEQMNMGGGEARRFASVASAPGLTNGLEFLVVQSNTERGIFPEVTKQMADFWQYADEWTNAVGALGSGEDFLSWDIRFSVPIVLPQGSQDRVLVRVSDDLTLLNLFHVVARGWSEAV